MPCFNTLTAWQTAPGEEVSFTDDPTGTRLQLPCGKCLGCRVTKAQEWATRLMHEAQSHRDTQFVTLTYSDEHLPSAVSPKHLRLFIKRLRQAAKTDTRIHGNKLRYFAAGEYGGITDRPHYHAILFGLRFKDEQRYNDTLKTSPFLTEIWGMGHARYGALTHQSAAYVAGYAGTKQTHQGVYCDSNGEIKHGPFMRCSTRPGIGHGYANLFTGDLLSGSVYSANGPSRIPRYYRKLLARDNPSAYEISDFAAYEKGLQQDPRKRSPEGLSAKLVLAQQRFIQKQRGF